MLRTRTPTATERARLRAAALAERGREASIELEERAAELAERLRESDALLRAKDKGADLATKTAQKLRDAHLDERAAELAERLREADLRQQASERARRATDDALGRVGGWLATTPIAAKLGVAPPRRAFPTWLAVLLGVGVGLLAGKLLSRGSAPTTVDEYVVTADQLTRDTADVVKARLGEDPRTAGLDELSVNVADGTVFVRGVVPSGYDEQALREVIAAVPGVRDVDLQVTVATG